MRPLAALAFSGLAGFVVACTPTPPTPGPPRPPAAAQLEAADPVSAINPAFRDALVELEEAVEDAAKGRTLDRRTLLRLALVRLGETMSLTPGVRDSIEAWEAQRWLVDEAAWQRVLAEELNARAAEARALQVASEGLSGLARDAYPDSPGVLTAAEALRTSVSPLDPRRPSSFSDEQLVRALQDAAAVIRATYVAIATAQ